MKFKRKPPDYPRYKGRTKWYVRDAIFLTLYRNPEYKFRDFTQIECIDPDKDRDSFEDIYENFKVFMQEGKIHYITGTGRLFDAKIEPYDFLAWAKDEGITIPEELLSILDNRPTTISKTPDFPPDTKWEDMTWVYLSNEMVRIDAKNVSKKYTCFHLGFTDKRKGDTPDTRWAILINFAENNGEIGWSNETKINEKARQTLIAAVRDIRKKLKKFFNINDDPFYPYRSTHSYKTKFTIKDKRIIDDNDHSGHEGFSMEEVEDELNDKS